MFNSDREAEPAAIRFASMGYHAFVLRYSVYSNSGISFPVPGRSPAYEKSVFPGSMREIGMAQTGDGIDETFSDILSLSYELGLVGVQYLFTIS